MTKLSRIIKILKKTPKMELVGRKEIEIETEFIENFLGPRIGEYLLNRRFVGRIKDAALKLGVNYLGGLLNYVNPILGKFVPMGSGEDYGYTEWGRSQGVGGKSEDYAHSFGDFMKSLHDMGLKYLLYIQCE